MDVKTAIEYLTGPAKRKASEIGKAVDVLYQEYHSYKAISQQLVGISPNFLSKRHGVFQLPEGIQWKIDEGYIGNIISIAKSLSMIWKSVMKSSADIHCYLVFQSLLTSQYRSTCPSEIACPDVCCQWKFRAFRPYSPSK